MPPLLSNRKCGLPHCQDIKIRELRKLSDSGSELLMGPQMQDMMTRPETTKQLMISKRLMKATPNVISESRS